MSWLFPTLFIGLAALPVLWWLLRTLPPPPENVWLPTARFLSDLVTPPTRTNTIPWWLRLIRLLLASAVILFLVGPVRPPENKILEIDAPVVLVLENGWAAAPSWTDMVRRAQTVLDQAHAAQKPVTLITTAAPDATSPPRRFAAMDATEARAQLATIAPLPWSNDMGFVKRELGNVKEAQLIWVGSGVDDGALNDVLGAFTGEVDYLAPARTTMPVLLQAHSQNDALRATARLLLPADMPTSFAIALHDIKGRVLDQQIVTLGRGESSADVSFALEENQLAQAAYLRTTQQASAAATVFLPTRTPKRNVALVADPQTANQQNYLDDAFYLKNALTDLAHLTVAPFPEIDLIAQDVLVLADTPVTQPETINTLETWLKNGGTLIRFAGPKLSDAKDDPFLPVRLRAGARALDSRFTREKPLGFAPWPEKSPLAGFIAPPRDVRIREQLLAEPLATTDPKIWATLEDGTPLITGAAFGKGMIVLVHTTAGPGWGDFALSGSFVQTLKRFLEITPARLNAPEAAQILAQVKTITMSGSVATAPTPAPTLRAADISKARISPALPPGLYGGTTQAVPLNLLDHSSAPSAATPPENVRVIAAGSDLGGYDFRPLLMMLALVLLLADGLALMWLRAQRAVMAALCLIFLMPTPAHAMDADDAAETFSLAYMRTGDAQVDALSESGLKALSKIVAERTAVVTGPVEGLTPAQTSDLPRYPLIYWPMTPGMAKLDSKAAQAVQTYLDRGGTILFDTRDQYFRGQDHAGMPLSRNAQLLRDVIAPLSVPPVVMLPNDHVLGRTFYILDDFPGAYTTATLYVAEDDMQDRDGVSAVIIGSNDYARGWAQLSDGADTITEEMAARVGVNIVLYALTGNYKTDQIHVQSILDRLQPSRLKLPDFPGGLE